MSRIGRKPVVVPAGVEVTVDANNAVTVKGPKGQLSEQISKLISVEVADGAVNVSRGSDHREHRSQHGLARTLINNMVTGVTSGFEKKLQLVGVGYRGGEEGQDPGAEPGIFTSCRTRGSGRHHHRMSVGDRGCCQRDRQGSCRQLCGQHQSMERA